MRRHNRARVGGDVAVMVSGVEHGRTTAGRALGGPPSCFAVAGGASPHQLSSDEHSSTGRGCISAFERRGVGEGCRDPCCSFVAGPCAWGLDACCCAVPLLTVFFLCFSLFCLSVVGVLCGGTTVRGLVGMWRSWCRAVNAVGRPLGGRWAGRRRASPWQSVRNPTSPPLMNTRAQGTVVFQFLNGGGSAKVAVIPCKICFRQGGGLYITSSSTVTLTSCTVSSNTAVKCICGY